MESAIPLQKQHGTWYVNLSDFIIVPAMMGITSLWFWKDLGLTGKAISWHRRGHVVEIIEPFAWNLVCEKRKSAKSLKFSVFFHFLAEKEGFEPSIRL
ncbi:hypothetical protein [Mucilaginibacter polytrichastri]|uniref:hypothetical protein n=1 Tax=Mucilaginibacter polytrichastri TaxID=1302689 RepID=UPI00094200D9|nr:hypothetical protein [Mucilaginibacter polytrichastri]